MEDAAKWAPNAKSAMKLTHDAGFRAVALSAVWSKGRSADADLPPLRRAVAAATDENVEPLLAVYQLSSSTPTSDTDRAAFARYAVALVKALPDVRTVLVGNEPNLNLFWMPQFTADGGDAAASAYEQLLAQTYDALKQADPKLTVVGANVSPRGSDDPSASRQTHSPTQFIEDFGAAYHASGRTKPIMDAFSIHVYGESPNVPPSFAHPNTTSFGIADYRKLTALLDKSFPPSLPIVYGEYGVETAVPAAKASAYSGTEVIHPVDEQTQARYYDDAIRMAACQPRVDTLLLFHVFDEKDLKGLQSGLYYVDGTPKASLAQVRPHLEDPKCR